MLAWWQLWQSFFRPESCENLINKGLELPVQTGVIGHGGTTHVNAEIRNSSIRWIDRNSDDWRSMVNRMRQIFQEANDNAYGFELTDLKEVQFTEYNVGQHYDWHEDLCWKKPNRCCHRKLSMVIQLSPPDSYEGGDLVLKNDPLPPDTLRSQGTVIVFPSFNMHRVTPVTRGIRRSLVAWYDGPKFK